jgi:uncharacterized phage protein (TIGR01671 family)
MRPIKFRAIVEDEKSGMNGRWIFGDLVRGKLYPTLKKSLIYIRDSMPQTHIVNPCTVGQYTGLKDCAGNEIYEGDILAIRYLGEDEYTIHAVDWCGIEYPAFDLFPQLEYCDSNSLSHMTNCGECEYFVVGNVHENKELLGGK